MRSFSIKSILLALSLTSASSFSAFAQDAVYKLPDRHTQQQNSLLVDQGKVNDQISLSVAQYIEFEDEEEPEDDIYLAGWDSGFVNCYRDVEVPQTAVIDVSKYAMPVPGYITSPYGYRKRFGRMHRGVDLKLQVGDTVYAAFSGKVRLTKFERKGYGYYVVIRHGNDLETVYGHLSKFLVKPDQYVKAGEPIALGGNTGRSTGPHLHFETRYMGYAINPSAIFDFANQTTHTDTYTFDKRTYEQPRNFSPERNAQYAKHYASTYPQSQKATTGSKATKRTYKVKKGDTLSKIAAHNGISISKLCKLNGLKSSSTLRIGQLIKLN